MHQARREALLTLTASVKELRQPPVKQWRLTNIFLFLPATCSAQGPYPPMYGVWFSWLGDTTHSLIKQECQGGCIGVTNHWLVLSHINLLYQIYELEELNTVQHIDQNRGLDY